LLLDRIYGINAQTFDSVARAVLQYQLDGNSLFRRYAEMIGFRGDDADAMPFLPISFFKSHTIQTGDWVPERFFRSSGTTGQVPSVHAVRDASVYHAIALKCFPSDWGKPEDHAWIGLLPSYLERPDASLVDMVRYFMQRGQQEEYFFRSADPALMALLKTLANARRRTILIGVSFALLDMVEHLEVPVWDELTVIETGGMKGRGREITRAELHARLRSRATGVRLSAEYGMTELFSQAYLSGVRFMPGPTMRVVARDISDPLQLLPAGERGALNVIDLGNVDTCAFIATEDTGLVHADGSFEVTGRLDAAELRGCNLMYTG
jgi:hypothetical protein